MRALLALAMVPLAACSMLLGIQEPSTGSDGGDGSGTDSGIDAPASDHLVFNVGDFKLAQLQSAHVHVVFVHKDGTMEDVTTTATYVSDNTAVVGAAAGVIKSVDTQSGKAMVTASLDGAAPVTVTVTVKTTLCHPVINELVTGTAAHGAADEFVEIYNPCTNMITVDGWTIDYRGKNVVGPGDSNLMAALTGMMLPGELRLYAGTDYPGAAITKWPNPSGIMAQTDGAVALRAGPEDTLPAGTAGGPIVDAVAYGAVSAGHPFMETKAAPVMSNGLSASRLPFDGNDDGGTDGDNSIDFKAIATPTPGVLNTP